MGAAHETSMSREPATQLLWGYRYFIKTNIKLYILTKSGTITCYLHDKGRAVGAKMDNKQKAKLIADAHHLKPVVMVGQKGLTTNVLSETDQALTAHELIKVKIMAEDKTERTAIADQIGAELNTTVLKIIGNIAIIYRKNPD